MTTMILQAVGSTLAGGSPDLIGGSYTALMGGLRPDRQITRLHDGAHLTDMPSLVSTEGAPIPRIYGRVRLGGTLIWATRFREIITQTTNETVTGGSRGGLGGKGGSRSNRATTTVTTVTNSYSYLGNFAIALCEGPVGFVRRIWADGQLLDWSALTVRFYKGDDRQDPDPLIVAKEGAENTPAYRGTAYLVFENFPLTPYGNRIPQFSFEVIRPVAGIARQIRSVNLIPAPVNLSMRQALFRAISVRAAVRVKTDRIFRAPVISLPRSMPCKACALILSMCNWWSAGSAMICAVICAKSPRVWIPPTRIRWA